METSQMRRTILIILISIIAGLGYFKLIAAQENGVEIKIVPENLQLNLEESALVAIVVRNKTDDQLKDIRLSWLTNAPLDIDIETSGPDIVPAKGSISWKLAITRAGAFVGDNSVHFIVEYTHAKENSSESLHELAFIALKVSSPQSVSIDSIASIKIRSSLKSLLEERPGIVYLTVSNLTDTPLQLQMLEMKGPDFINFTPPNFPPSNLLPFGSLTIPISVSATDQVQPGNHLLLFEWPFTRQINNNIETYHLIATHEVEVGVFGESEILKVFTAVPSFLILPGFIFALTLTLLSKKLFPYDFKTQEFWLVAVTFSLIMVFIYPFLSDLYGPRRSFRVSYGFNDIVAVWGFSILFAILIRLGEFGFTEMKTRYIESRFPSVNDEPIDTVRKLKRRGHGLELDSAQLNANEQKSYRVYYLTPFKAGKTEYWITPRIKIFFSSGGDEELHRKIRTEAIPSGDPERLADLLTQGKEAGDLTVVYDEESFIRHPELKPEDELTPSPTGSGQPIKVLFVDVIEPSD